MKVILKVSIPQSPEKKPVSTNIFNSTTVFNIDNKKKKCFLSIKSAN